MSSTEGLWRLGVKADLQLVSVGQTFGWNHKVMGSRYGTNYKGQNRRIWGEERTIQGSDLDGTLTFLWLKITRMMDGYSFPIFPRCNIQGMSFCKRVTWWRVEINSNSWILYPMRCLFALARPAGSYSNPTSSLPKLLENTTVTRKYRNKVRLSNSFPILFIQPNANLNLLTLHQPSKRIKSNSSTHYFNSLTLPYCDILVFYSSLSANKQAQGSY